MTLLPAQSEARLPRARGGARPRTSGVRSGAKRERIVSAAMRRFAAGGFQGTRVEDIAADLGISKASVLQHFGSKRLLFLAAYEQAITMFPKYLDAPEDVTKAGFFPTIEYWLTRYEHLVGEHWVPYRVVLLGEYCSDLELRREIARLLRERDPYGTVEFVSAAMRDGELRTDLDFEMVVSLVDWLVDRVLDALVSEELDPGLFRARADPSRLSRARLGQFLALLERAVGAPGNPRG